MRRAAKVDDNQAEIVQLLRAAGWSVQLLHQVGGGCPDILAGKRNKNIILEIKNGQKPPSERKLTPDQIIWHRDWRGQKAIVSSPEEALAIAEAMLGI